MSVTTSVRDALAGTTLRTAINAGLTTAGLPTFGDPTLGHADLQGLVAYAPRLPSLAVNVRQLDGRALATGHDVYQATFRVRFTAAIAGTIETAVFDWGAQYTDILRAIVMTQCSPEGATKVGGFEEIKWVGSNPEGEPFTNDGGVVSLRVTVDFEVWECIAVRTA